MIYKEHAALLQSIESQMLAMTRKCEKVFTGAKDPRGEDPRLLDPDMKVILNMYKSFKSLKKAASQMIDEYYKVTNADDPNQMTIMDYEEDDPEMRAIEEKWAEQDEKFEKELKKLEEEERKEQVNDEGPEW